MGRRSVNENLTAQLIALSRPSDPIDEAVYSRGAFLERGLLRSGTPPSHIVQVIFRGLGITDAAALEAKCLELTAGIDSYDATSNIPPDARIIRGFFAFEEAVADKYGSIIYRDPIEAARTYALSAIAAALLLEDHSAMPESA